MESNQLYFKSSSSINLLIFCLYISFRFTLLSVVFTLITAVSYMTFAVLSTIHDFLFIHIPILIAAFLTNFDVLVFTLVLAFFVLMSTPVGLDGLIFVSLFVSWCVALWPILTLVALNPTNPN